MFNKLKQIISCELTILRLKKQIRILEANDNSADLSGLKQQLLTQLELNLTHPFGFTDMKQLAIAELRRELIKPPKSVKTKPRISKAKKAIVASHELVCE